MTVFWFAGLKTKKKTSGGIIIPDTAKEKPMHGEVVAIGPGARADKGEVRPLDVKIGDHVLFGKWAGTENQNRRGRSARDEGRRYHGHR